MKYTRMCCEYRSLPIIFFDVSDEAIAEMNASDDFISLKSTVTDAVFVDVYTPYISLSPIPAGLKLSLFAEE